MKHILSLIFVSLVLLPRAFFVSFCPALYAAENPAATANSGIHHSDRFKEKAKIVAEGNIDFVMVGDSITHFWDGTGKAQQEKYFGKYRRVNLGLGWNGTQHVLWELENIKTEAISPKAVMLMIGTNNIGWLKQTPQQAIGGIQAVLNKLRESWPNAKILLLGVFPRGAEPTDRYRAMIDEINAAIEKMADGETIVYLNINDRFLTPEKVLPAEIMPDRLHPNAKGYEIWGEAVSPILEGWLNP